MRKTLASLLLTALMLSAAAGPALADSSGKPLAVVSFSGYSELKADLAYVGKLADNPNLAAGLEFLLQMAMQGRPLNGLDKDRPWALVVQADTERLAAGGTNWAEILTGLVYLPVTDQKKLLTAFEPWVGKPEDAADGIVRLAGAEGHKQGNPVFVKSLGKWSVLSNRAERLAAAPADPLPLLAGLEKKYDLAVRLNLDVIPESLRRQAIAGAQENARRGLQQRPGEADEQYAVRKIVSQRVLRTVVGALEDVQQVTLGWALDHEAGKTFLELAATVRPDTPTARKLALRPGVPSAFAGFLLPDAAMTGHWTAALGRGDSTEMRDAVELLRKKSLADIDKEPRTERQTEAARKLVGGLFDVLQANLASARIDGGMTAILDEDAATLAAGGFVADGARLSGLLKELVRVADEENPAVGQFVKLDAAEHAGVKFHAIRFPVPYEAENREQIVKAIGENVEIVVGVGAESVYVGAGRDPIKLIEQVIDRSAQAASQDAAPLRMSLALDKLTRFLSVAGKESDRPKMQRAAALLAPTAGKDHLNLVAEPIERGLRLRLELEPGVLQALGSAATPH